MSARVKLALLVGALVISASSARATTIRPGSNYGPGTSYFDCSTGVSSPCEGAQTDGTDVIGGTTYTVYQFASGDAAGDLIDLIDFTDVGAGDTVTLPVVNTSLAIGVFSCGDHPLSTPVTQVEDSGGATLPVEPPCTLDGDAASVAQGTNVEQFTNGGTGAIDNLVLFTVDGNLSTGSVAAPEPGSLGLLGFGLIAVALFALRRLPSKFSDAS